MLEPTQIYDGKVTVKMTANHSYYVQYNDGDPNEKPKWIRSQGVTGALEELYDQKALIGWAAGQAAGKVVKTLAGAKNEEWLDKAFLEIWKGNSPELPLRSLDLKLGSSDLIHLYKEGTSAHEKKAQYGKDVGTQVHECIDRYHRTGEAILELSGVSEQDEVAQQSLDGYIKWFTKSGLRILETERVVHSRAYNYCGTLDRIYVDSKGGLLIGDFKTSNVSRSTPTGIRPQYWSQLGAYANAYTEETGKTFVDSIIINSPKNGKIQVVRGSSLGIPVSAERCVQLWKADLQAFRNHKQVLTGMKGVSSEA